MTPSPTPITKRLRRVQAESSATLHLLHKVGRVELYARQRRGKPMDYGVVRGNLASHGVTPAEALGAMRAQLQQRVAERTRPLSWQDGLDEGFPPECLAQFCQDYGLDPQGQASSMELAHLVSQPGTPNRQAYIRALRRLGIHLK